MIQKQQYLRVTMSRCESIMRGFNTEEGPNPFEFMEGRDDYKIVRA